MHHIQFDALVQAVGSRASRRRVLGGLAALAVGAGQIKPAAAGRRCSRCQQHADCPGQAKCQSYRGKQSCCNGYWWRGDCYKDKRVKRKGWRWYVDSGTLYYCKGQTGIQVEAALICKG